MSIRSPCECCGARESAYEVWIGDTLSDVTNIKMCGPCRNFIRLHFPPKEGKRDENKSREVGFRKDEE